MARTLGHGSSVVVRTLGCGSVVVRTLGCSSVVARTLGAVV